MIIAHYAHRLPADYDIGIIRNRAKSRGHLFDAVPELHFKGFLLRERGRFGRTNILRSISGARMRASAISF